ncbi:hypothetical protein PCANC_20410 [Puccinia coronata f. sp. avenae]|uniref:Uncharacterized protein n=1 Tax=Puccinia coronata f. sp. avenae TaxID=200324 RepID=A0A2N5SMZ2_9BASI|nr:hypothetical protein PCANC_20410 [Puccinia coronata f. sp. avenae]
MINWEILKKLLDLFSDTLITLDLKFVNVFTLPSHPIKAIGRIKSLQTLRLDLAWPHPTQLGTAVATDHPSCLNRLLVEAQSLKSLRLALPVSLPVSLLLKPDLMAGIQYPAITHLELSLDDLSLDVALGISIALKPTLKLLSVCHSLPMDETRNAYLLRPVYEALRESIEGLAVSSHSCLTPLLNLSFPKLRYLAKFGRLEAESTIDLLSQGMLSQSPIQVIALCPSYDFTVVDTFSAFPQLQKVVFMDAGPDKPRPPLAAFKARKIECIFVDHTDVSRIMASQKH